MSKRIRYVAGPIPDSFVSLQVFSNGKGREFKTMIEPGGKTGMVVEPDGTVVDKVSGTSSHKTKIALKEALSKLGAVFEKEERVRSAKSSGTGES